MSQKIVQSILKTEALLVHELCVQMCVVTDVDSTNSHGRIDLIKHVSCDVTAKNLSNNVSVQRETESHRCFTHSYCRVLPKQRFCQMETESLT